MGEETLIRNILDDKMFGFVKCTIYIPDNEMRQKWKDLNFPVSFDFFCVQFLSF